jgi:DNA-binding CsgD family transcriptional regulator
LSTVDAMTQSELLNDAGVSEREAEVLALVGEHLRNAQIAGRLFISVRTVESHVSSLLRKLNVTDRRGLAGVAAALTAEGRDTARITSASLPLPLSSFVGRAAERAALADVLARHRLVTAIGPGGVGKTRLAVAVAADVADGYVDGAWYVDLVPVTDPGMVGAAVASALGFSEQPGRSPTDTMAAKLAGARGPDRARQLRARRGWRDGVRRTVAHRVPEGDRVGDEPGPVAAALRVRVPGAGAVAR